MAERDEVQPEGAFARERQEQIAALVDDKGHVRVTDLAARYSVSAVTIRKDLYVLENERRLVRTHGGAMAAAKNRMELAFEVRERLRREEKEHIGTFAAGLVHDGESIALDASSTAFYVASALKSREHLQVTVVTNGIRIAQELGGQPGTVVLMPGGRVRYEAMSLIGPLGASIYKSINVQKAFVGAAGFTIESGLSDSMEEEAQIKRAMVDGANEVIAIVDHTKWGRASSATFCRTDRITAVLTDAEAPVAMVESLRKVGIRVCLLGPGGEVE